MDTYKIEVEEILQHVFEVEADSPSQALDIIKEKYREGEIIIMYSDLKETNFREVE